MEIDRGTLYGIGQYGDFNQFSDTDRTPRSRSNSTGSILSENKVLRHSYLGCDTYNDKRRTHEQEEPTVSNVQRLESVRQNKEVGRETTMADLPRFN